MTVNPATKALVSNLRVLVDSAGVECGILEMLQGNTRPDGPLVGAVGPAQKV